MVMVLTGVESFCFAIAKQQFLHRGKPKQTFMLIGGNMSSSSNWPLHNGDTFIYLAFIFLTSYFCIITANVFEYVLSHIILYSYCNGENQMQSDATDIKPKSTHIKMEIYMFSVLKPSFDDSLSLADFSIVMPDKSRPWPLN